MTKQTTRRQPSLEQRALELKEILGHADITMTLRYAHLSPAHLRSAMLKTEREALPAASTQDSAQEVVAVLEASRK